MRLPWHKQRVPEERFEEARAGVRAAQEHLDKVRAAQPEVDATKARSKYARDRNHFSEGIQAMLKMEGRGHAPHA